MKNKDSKARMQMIFGILLFAFIFMAELYAIVNFEDVYCSGCFGSSRSDMPVCCNQRRDFSI